MLYSPSSHASGKSSGFYFDDDKNAPSDSFLVSEKDHGTAINLVPGSTYTFSFPVSPDVEGVITCVEPTAQWLAAKDQAEAKAALAESAQTALTKSDLTVLRCLEKGVAVPAEVIAYRAALRQIVNGTDTTSKVLPTEPAKPAI